MTFGQFPRFGNQPAGTAQGQPPPPQFQQPPPAQFQPAPPPPAPAPVAPALPDSWVMSPGGQSVQVSGAQLATMPPTTQVHFQGQWIPLHRMPGYAGAGQPQSPQQFHQQPQHQPQQFQQPRGFEQHGGGIPSAAVFATAGSAQVYHKNDNVQPGNYVFRIHEVVWKESNKYTGAIIEAEVLYSTYDPSDPQRVSCNRVGTRCSAFIKKNVTFDSNMKGFILALSGFDAQGNPRPDTEHIAPAEFQAVFGPDQPAAGTLVYVEARNIRINNDTQDFTKLNWWPIKTLPDGSPDLTSVPR